MDEYVKKLIDLGVSAAEKRFSAQTGYVHLKYHALDDEVHYTLPIVENFLFSLGLLRTKSIENITRGKAILEKLLHFQNASGNFPVYLHEYPECKDHDTAVKLLAPIYWMYHGFAQVLGADLKKKLETCLRSLIDYCLHNAKTNKLPYCIRMRVAAAAFAIGKLFNLSDLEEDGQERLKEFNSKAKEWFCPGNLADLMISSQMVDPDLNKSFLPQFLDHLCQTWHIPLNCYAGPKILEYQSGLEPEVSLYDLFMGYFTKQFSKRALKDDPVHLQAVLIQPFETLFRDSLGYLEGSIESGQKFTCFKEKDYSYAFTEMNPSQANNKGFSPFSFKFGTPDRLHTFALEGGNYKKINLIQNGDILEFYFTLDQLPELEDKEKSREIAFYFDLSSATTLLVDGTRANTFQLGNEVMIHHDQFSFKLCFELEAGDGQFLGHFMRGNRPSQIANKGNQRFSAFDSQVFLRTIRRSAHEETLIKATLAIIEN